MEDSARIELLTDELRRLVGRGAKPMRLVTCPILRECSLVDDSLSVAAMGSTIHHHLIDTVAHMTGVYDFQGNVIDGAILRRVLRLLLEIEGRGQYADKRRERVLHILGLPYPFAQMRRPQSPERELLRLLAVQLVNQNAS